MIEGPFEETMEMLKELVEKEKPSAVISVGDIVTQNMIKCGLSLNVLIIDNKTMRKPIQPIKVDTDQTLYSKNPPGTITDEAWNVIKQATEYKGQTKVIIVVVKVTEEKRKKMRRIVDLMEEPSKS